MISASATDLSRPGGPGGDHWPGDDRDRDSSISDQVVTKSRSNLKPWLSHGADCHSTAAAALEKGKLRPPFQVVHLPVRPARASRLESASAVRTRMIMTRESGSCLAG